MWAVCCSDNVDFLSDFVYVLYVNEQINVRGFRKSNAEMARIPW